MDKKETVKTSKITEEELVTYFGNNSMTFLNKFNRYKNGELNFNFLSALFGVPYLMYRKMYLLSFFTVLVGMILNGSFLSVLLLSFALGILTDYLYCKKAEYIISDIKKSKRSASIKKELIRQQGGVDALASSLILIVELTCILFAIISFVAVIY